MAGPFAARLLFFTALWVGLTHGEMTPLPLVVSILLVVTVMSLLYRGPVHWRWRLSGLIRFVPFFLIHSLVGGVDVGSRAFRRKVPMAPAILKYKLRLRPLEPPALFFVGTLNLLPGTLCAAMDEDMITVHVVDAGQGNQARLEKLEAYVAALFGEPFHGADSGPSV